MKKDYYLAQVIFYKNTTSNGIYHLGLKFRSRTELNRIYKLLLNEPYPLVLGKNILGSRKRSYRRFPVIEWFPGEINFKLTSIEYDRFRDDLIIIFNQDDIREGLSSIDKILEELDIIPIDSLSIGKGWICSMYPVKNYLELI